MVIDLHAHFIPQKMIDFIEHHGTLMDRHIETRNGRLFVVTTSTGHGIPVFPGHHDIDILLSDAANMGIDKSVLSIAPLYFNYSAPAEVGLNTSQIANDWVAEQSRRYPDRVAAMMTLPMQDTAVAMQELVRAHKELGIHAVEISCIINGKMLDDEAFFPIFEYCSTNNILVYLHPCVHDNYPFYKRYYNNNLIGNILETSIAANHLIFGGVFEALPALRVLLSHGGGYFPYQFGRLTHGYEVRKEPKVNIPHPPAHYLKNLYYDTITHNTNALQFLVDTFGVQQVVLGTDYPYDMGDNQPVDHVNALRLTEAQRQMILCENAQKLMPAI